MNWVARWTNQNTRVASTMAVALIENLLSTALATMMPTAMPTSEEPKRIASRASTRRSEHNYMPLAAPRGTDLAWAYKQHSATAVSGPRAYRSAVALRSSLIPGSRTTAFE